MSPGEMLKLCPGKVSKNLPTTISHLFFFISVDIILILYNLYICRQKRNFRGKTKVNRKGGASERIR